MSAQIVLMLVSGVLLGSGVWSFIDPSIFTHIYGLEMPTPESRIIIRSIIGGGEIALGLILALGHWLGLSVTQRLRMAFVIFASVIAARLGATAMERSFVAQSMREFSIELLILLVVGFFAFRKAAR